MSARTTHALRLALLATTALSLATAGCATVPAVIIASIAGAQDKPTLDGSWEIKFDETGDGGWTDPASPVARRFEFYGNPMGGDPGNGMRTFATFDPKNTFIGTYSFDDVNNKLLVDPPYNNPFIGHRLEEQPDGTFSTLVTQFQSGDSNGQFDTDLNAALVFGPDDAGGWRGRIEFTFVFTAVSAAAEDQANNLPAINVGDTATFKWNWYLTLTPSDPPALLFPDARWEIAGD